MKKDGAAPVRQNWMNAKYSMLSLIGRFHQWINSGASTTMRTCMDGRSRNGRCALRTESTALTGARGDRPSTAGRIHRDGGALRRGCFRQCLLRSVLAVGLPMVDSCAATYSISEVRIFRTSQIHKSDCTVSNLVLAPRHPTRTLSTLLTASESDLAA